MTNSLVAGLSGLRVHQQLIDIVGNNLANANTPGFKSSRATFAEILTSLLRQGTAPTSTVGGTNPIQEGLGVRLGTVDMNISQGSLSTTGRTFDMALQGDGFFMLSNGSARFYTRAGTFGLDANSQLVDLKNGFKVLSPLGENISVDTTGLFRSKITESIELKGNLPARVNGPKRAILKSDTPYLDGDPAVLDSTTGPYDLSGAVPASLLVAINGASPVTLTFASGDFSNVTTATAAEVAAEINDDLTALGLSGTLSASVSSGAVRLTTSLTGTDASIRITDSTGSPNTVLGFSTSLVTGSEDNPVTGSTLINDLPDNPENYATGAVINISGSLTNGDTVSGQFIYGTDGTTMQDLIDKINEIFESDPNTEGSEGATASLDSSGNLILTSDTPGSSNLSISISDSTSDSATGSTLFSAHTMQVFQTGTNADTVVTSIPIYDSLGIGHNLTLTFTRRSDDLKAWDLSATIPTEDGNVTSETIENIQFSPSGSLSSTGSAQSLAITFTGLSSQAIDLHMGTIGQIDGLSQFGTQQTAQAVSQDGYAEGTLSTLSVREDGVIQGVYSNGQIQDLGTVGVATFRNPVGLQRLADTLFAVTTNSGSEQPGQALSGSAGAIKSGVLENSNVEVAEEFVKLVEAQRGFQASAKVIQTTDQLLGDLNQII